MRIKELREARGLTQNQLADRVGVCQAAVGKWETSAAYPAAEKLPRLAAALGCTIDALYSMEPPGMLEAENAAS